MNKTLVLWTHGGWSPYAGIYAVDVKRVQDFEATIRVLSSPEARKNITVLSFLVLVKCNYLLG